MFNTDRRVFFFISVHAAADKVNYTYDDAGRLIKAKYGDGKTIEYTHDKTGNLVQRSITQQTPDADEDTCPNHQILTHPARILDIDQGFTVYILPCAWLGPGGS